MKRTHELLCLDLFAGAGGFSERIPSSWLPKHRGYGHGPLGWRDVRTQLCATPVEKERIACTLILRSA